MRKFFTQYPRGTSFEGAYNFVGCYMRCGFHKQVNVVGLDSQSVNSPTVFLCHFVADFTQAHRNPIHQHFLAPFWYPDEVVTDLVDHVIRAFNIIRFHVDSLTHIDSVGKGNVRCHPRAKARGFPTPESYNRLCPIRSEWRRPGWSAPRTASGGV